VSNAELHLRVARIHVLAERILGSAEKAQAWLRTPAPTLDDQLPLSLLDTEEGRHAVEAVLGRIEHGVFS
jgi:putative toxin-antitoxin system antitoxin component (TIGR02293 family)